MGIKIKAAIIILILISYSCKNKAKESNRVSEVINKDILTDSSINSNTFDKTQAIEDTQVEFSIETSINKISLLDSESLLKIISSPIFIESEESEFPELIILNSDKTQKLTALFYPGSEKNNVSYFILEKNNSMHSGKNIFDTSIMNFFTNNDIALGMDGNLLKNKYLSNKLKLTSELLEKGYEQLTYLVNDIDNPFLKEYNMPLYSAKYYLFNNEILKIEFGFEYP